MVVSRMANCTKCGTITDHPIKVWKIKQTPIALFECPSCKTKWKSKLIESKIVPVAIEKIQVPNITEKPSDEKLSSIIETKVENRILETNKPTGFLSGIK